MLRVWAAVTFAGMAVAHAEPLNLKFATIAPEGTAWARELNAFARDAETLSRGELRMRWIMGGVAGAESLMPDRIKKGQLQGAATSITCERLGPSLRVLRILGLFRRREEAYAILDRLKLEKEFRAAGFVMLGVTWFGSDHAFSREPIRTLADLKVRQCQGTAVADWVAERAGQTIARGTNVFELAPDGRVARATGLWSR